MVSILLCHSNCDRLFVEKLACDLRRLGVNAWFDRWVIGVGESLHWQIEQGVREGEYFAVLLSPDTLQSERVKTELGSTWVKQLRLKTVVVVPLLYGNCDIPLFLADMRYADFRLDYESGLSELASMLGLHDAEVVSESNWRRYTRSKSADWKRFRDGEFRAMVTVLVDRAIDYNWSTWVGGTANPYSITLSARSESAKQSVSLKMTGREYGYKATLMPAWNPNKLKSREFTIPVGTTVQHCEEFVWRIMDDFERDHGRPTEEATHFTERFSRQGEAFEVFQEVLRQFNWYAGTKL